MQFITETLEINTNGTLSLGGYELLAVAKEFGTPCYVMDEALIRKNCRSYKNSIDRKSVV